MAYKYGKISPSALAATERCPRFRADGEDTQAGIDGTMFHDMMEAMVTTVQRDGWRTFASTRTASPQLLGLLESATERVLSVVDHDMPVFEGHRLRLVRGKPRKAPLKPGLYPECEVDRGGGRHGYIDLMVVTEEGLVYILDYKSNRVGKDFSWQLGAYAVDVNRLCEAHDHFICEIIAPRLDDEEQLRMQVGPEELAELRTRIESIEVRADDALWNEGILSCPGDQCEHCHAKGWCRAQAEAMNLLVSEAPSVTTMSAAGRRAATIRSFSALVGPGGPYEGEVVSPTTFTAPDTPAQRGLRRACLKFVETLVKAAKDDDSSWASQFTEEQVRNMVPGYTVSYRAGRGTVDQTRMADIRQAAMSTLGLTIEDVFDVSSVDKDRLVEYLVAQGDTKTAATDKVKRLFEPYTTAGAPVLYWTQCSPVRARALAADFVPAARTV